MTRPRRPAHGRRAAARRTARSSRTSARSRSASGSDVAGLEVDRRSPSATRTPSSSAIPDDAAAARPAARDACALPGAHERPARPRRRPARRDRRVWERGAGETLASGTSAVAVAAATHGDGEVVVTFPGGDLPCGSRRSCPPDRPGRARRVGAADRRTGQRVTADRCDPLELPGGRGQGRDLTLADGPRLAAADAVLAQRVVQARPSGRSTRSRRPMISAQASWYVPGRELLRPRARDDDRARRHVAAVLDRLGARSRR